jgi:hypothetical protein
MRFHGFGDDRLQIAAWCCVNVTKSGLSFVAYAGKILGSRMDRHALRYLGRVP